MPVTRGIVAIRFINPLAEKKYCFIEEYLWPIEK
jgi:hypothetical protein